MTQNYLEVARAATFVVAVPDDRAKFLKNLENKNRYANAQVATGSISVIYSYLAIESFVNYQLYLAWTRRHEDPYFGPRFLELLNNVDEFQKLKGHKKIRDLGERIKTYYKIKNFEPIDKRNPGLWQMFKHLLELSRHFLVHLFPDPELFNERMNDLAVII